MARKSGNLVDIHVSVDPLVPSEVVVRQTSFPISAGRVVALMKRGDYWRNQLEPHDTSEGVELPEFGPVADAINRALADDDRIAGWFIADTRTLIVQLNDLGWDDECSERTNNALDLAQWLCEVLQGALSSAGSRRRIEFAAPAFTLFADYHRTPMDVTT